MSHLTDLQLDALAADELEDAAALAHAHDCPTCARVADQFRQLRAAARDGATDIAAGIEALDAAVYDLAEETAVRIGARRRAPWRVLIAAAALIALALAVTTPWQHAGPGAAARNDINADGRQDILDALVVARGLAAGDSIQTRWDVTDDGIVDHRDVDSLARSVVSMSGAAR